MAINGPRIQLPPANSPLVTDAGTVSQDFQVFFHSIQQTAFNVSRSGTTASRPTSKLDGRFVGMPYFDTTLGFEIWIKSVNPDVWVRYDGTAV